MIQKTRTKSMLTYYREKNPEAAKVLEYLVTKLELEVNKVEKG